MEIKISLPSDSNLDEYIKKIKMSVDTKIVEQGMTKQFILQYEGSQQILKPNGEASVVNLVLGSLEDNTLPFQVYNSLLDFSENYGIPLTTTLILKKDYKDNDYVLYYNGNKYEIGLFSDNKVTEVTNNTIYKSKDVEIKGRIVGKFENFFFKTK
jgi:hypothetical protein